jgi:hypothetical protein
MTESLTAAQIHARITRGGFDSKTEARAGDDWGKKLYELSNCDGGTPALLALTHAYEDFDSTETLDPEEFAELFRRTYRQYWDTPAAFAEHVAQDESGMGDKDESAGRAWFMKHYGHFIDWDEVAQSPEIVNTYSLITLDTDSSRGVHVFELEA